MAISETKVQTKPENFQETL